MEIVLVNPLDTFALEALVENLATTIGVHSREAVAHRHKDGSGDTPKTCLVCARRITANNVVVSGCLLSHSSPTSRLFLARHCSGFPFSIQTSSVLTPAGGFGFIFRVGVAGGT